MTSQSLSDYERYDALGLAELVRKGEVTPQELVEAAIARIEQRNPALNAVIHKAYELARTTAAGPLPEGPFKGVPFLLKDLSVDWAGLPMNNGSFYFKDYVSQEDSEYVQRIKQTGFVLVGKTNVPENGWCLSTEPHLHGPTHNAWKHGISAGGSSGGSSVAVASGMVPLADASDGAGSIRVPAANNGIVGLKPSRGRVPLGPYLVDFWYGGAVFLCVSRTVRDTAAYFDAVTGGHPGEPYPHAVPERPFLLEVGRDPGRLKIAFTTKAPDGGLLHPDVAAGVAATAKLLAGLGHVVEERDFTFDFATLWQTYTRMIQVQTVMGFQMMEPLVGRPVTPDDVLPTTWSVLEEGRRVDGATHSADVEALRMHSRRIGEETAPYDVYITPVMPQPPRPLGYLDMAVPSIHDYNAKMGPDCVFTAPFNVSGQPAMTLPLAWSGDGLPIGIQLVGRYGEEALLFRIAAQLEQVQPWADRRPPPA